MTAPVASDAERDAWAALASVHGVGLVTFERMLARWGSAEAALEAIDSMPAASADRRLARELQMRQRSGLARDLQAAARDPLSVQREMAALGGWLLTPLDPAYPDAFHHLAEPPLVIYGIGRRDALRRSHSVALVGTRRPTTAARDLTHRVAERLVAIGATVVSGLALGVDGAAHQSVLEAGGETVAVVGGGLDRPGPGRHRRLAVAIASHGAVVGELAPSVSATRGTYPRRNRLIAALASATIVIEAPARSGALITARHALEQGKQLFVAPGRPLDRRIAGSLALLRESPAIPLVGLDELVADLGFGGPDHGAAISSNTLGRLDAEIALRSLGEQERVVAEAIARGPQTVDRLCQLTGIETGVVSAALTILQMRGWIRVLGNTHLPAGPLLAVGEA